MRDQELVCRKCKVRMPITMMDTDPKSKDYMVCIFCKAREREFYRK